MNTAMNPLEEYPNLFANGEFSARVLAYDEDDVFHTYNITSVRTLNNVTQIGLSTETDGDPKGISYQGATEYGCTLIARKIDSLTEEEVEAAYPDLHMTGKNFIQDSMIKDIKEMKLPASDLLWLLSLGIYPFSQNHFSEGLVIDADTLGEEE